MFRFGPIGKHDGYGRQNLDGNTRGIALVNPLINIPAIALNVAKDLSVFEHSRTTRLCVLNTYKTGVTVFILKIRPILGNDMRVYIDFEHFMRQ